MPKLIGKVVDGKLVVISLIEWAARLNAANTLAPPKVKKK